MLRQDPSLICQRYTHTGHSMENARGRPKLIFHKYVEQITDWTARQAITRAAQDRDNWRELGRVAASMLNRSGGGGVNYIHYIISNYAIITKSYSDLVTVVTVMVRFMVRIRLKPQPNPKQRFFSQFTSHYILLLTVS